jgi:hypothetical protein
MDELHKMIEPFLVEDYRALKIGPEMTLEHYLKLRKHEISANELRFPGYSEFYLNKVKRAKKWFMFGKIACFILVIKSFV